MVVLDNECFDINKYKKLGVSHRIMGILRQTLQYGTMSLALLGGMGAEHMYQKSKGQEQPKFKIRQPREPCIYQPEKQQELPTVPEKPIFFGIAAIVVALAAKEMRRRHDQYLEQLTQRRWNAENFFHTKDDYNF